MVQPSASSAYSRAKLRRTKPVAPFSQNIPRSVKSFAFLTLLLNRERIIGLRLGAAQQNISQILLKNLENVKPPDDLVSQFSKNIAPMFDGILTLQRQIQNLRRTRDLLLPRLLSGTLNFRDMEAIHSSTAKEEANGKNIYPQRTVCESLLSISLECHHCYQAGYCW